MAAIAPPPPIAHHAQQLGAQPVSITAPTPTVQGSTARSTVRVRKHNRRATVSVSVGMYRGNGGTPGVLIASGSGSISATRNSVSVPVASLPCPYGTAGRTVRVWVVAYTNTRIGARTVKNRVSSSYRAIRCTRA